MRPIVRGLIIMLLLLSMAGIARAENDTKTAAGLTMSINRWKSERPDSESRLSSVSVLVGWAAEAELSNDVFVEASYLFSVSDYVFYQAGVATRQERSDVDVAAGYQFNNYVGVFAGYRSSQFRTRVTKDKKTVHGPLIGVRGEVPVNNALTLFGRLTYLPRSIQATFAATDEKNTALGWFARAGVRYVFTSRVTGALGYQYETTKGKDAGIVDTFTGATLGAMYSF